MGTRNLALVAVLAVGVAGVGGAFAQTRPASRPVGRPAATRPVGLSTRPSDSNFRSHKAWNDSCAARVAAAKGKPVDVVFVGDSITEHFVSKPSPAWDLVGSEAWEKHYGGKNYLDFGVGADRTDNVLWRMENMDVKDLRPKVVVVMIGTNNTQDSAEEIAKGVKAVVEKTREVWKGSAGGPKVILVSILPNARANEKMMAVNELIKPIADEKDVFYFDLASKFVKEGNSWKGLGKDRLHVTEEGYEMWASEMEPLLAKLLTSPN